MARVASASSLAAVLAVALLALPCSAQTAPRASAPPSYPWLIEPIDAIYGHLTEGAFQEPFGVCFEAKARELYVADSRHGLIGIFDAERTPLFSFGGPGVLLEPSAVLAESDGSIFVLDAPRSELRAFNYRGEPRASLRFERAAPAPVAKPGRRSAPQSAPAGEPAGSRPAAASSGPLRIGAFAHDAAGRWYVADAETRRVLVYDKERRYLRDLAPSPRSKSFALVTDIAVSPQGLVAVIDMQGAPAITVYDAEGVLLAAFGERDVGLKDFTAPSAVAFDERGFLYGVDLLRHDVKVFTVKGEFVEHFGGWSTPETRGRGPGELLYPVDIAIDPQGPIYVAERYGGRVQAFGRRLRPAAASAPASTANR